MATLGMLVEEFKDGGSLEPSLGCALIGLAAVLFLMLPIYGVRSLS